MQVFFQRCIVSEVYQPAPKVDENGERRYSGDPPLYLTFKDLQDGGEVQFSTRLWTREYAERVRAAAAALEVVAVVSPRRFERIQFMEIIHITMKLAPATTAEELDALFGGSPAPKK